MCIKTRADRAKSKVAAGTGKEKRFDQIKIVLVGSIKLAIMVVRLGHHRGGFGVKLMGEDSSECCNWGG